MIAPASNNDDPSGERGEASAFEVRHLPGTLAASPGARREPDRLLLAGGIPPPWSHGRRPRLLRDAEQSSVDFGLPTPRPLAALDRLGGAAESGHRLVGRAGGSPSNDSRRCKIARSAAGFSGGGWSLALSLAFQLAACEGCGNLRTGRRRVTGCGMV